MTDDNGDRPANHEAVVQRTFAGMLGELEDVATTLTQRQAALAKELSDVEAELHRVEAVRAAMAGGPVRRKAKTASASPKAARAPEVQAKVDKTLAWARERGGEFTPTDVAELLDTDARGVGSLLSGMARREELTVREDAGRRYYSVA